MNQTNPSSGAVRHVEMIRDGGSFAAFFEDSYGHEYSLITKIRTQFLLTGDIEVLGYAEPVFRVPRVARPISTSWEQAAVLLDQVRQVINENQNMEWLALMGEIISGRGKLPASIERVQKVVRNLRTES